MDAGFDEWLGHIGVFVDIKCVRLYTPSDDGQSLRAQHEWTHPAFERQAPPEVVRDFPWSLGLLQESQSVIVSSSRDLPPEAGDDLQSMERYGYKAMLVLPMVSGQRALGALAFGGAEERSWPDEIVTQLRLVAEVLANALARKQTEDALRASETMKSSILHSLRSGVAVVDREGAVLALNENWTRLANESGEASVEVGERLFGDRPAAGGPSRTCRRRWARHPLSDPGPARELRVRVRDAIRQDAALVGGCRRSARSARWWSGRDPCRRHRSSPRRARRAAGATGAGARRPGVHRRRADGVARARALSAADGDHDQRAGGPADARRVDSRCLSGRRDPLRYRQRRPARARRHRALARSSAQGAARDGPPGPVIGHSRRRRPAARRCARQAGDGDARPRDRSRHRSR